MKAILAMPPLSPSYSKPYATESFDPIPASPEPAPPSEMDALMARIRAPHGPAWMPPADDFIIAARHGSGTALALLFNAICPPELELPPGNRLEEAANAVDSNGVSALALAASLGAHGAHAVQLLLSHGANPNFSTSPPAQASASAPRALLRMFSTPSPGNAGKSPLCFAAESNATRSIQVLLSHGALLDKGFCNEDGLGPLAIAVARGFSHAAQLLVAAAKPGAPWEQGGAAGLSAVALACSSCSPQLLGDLLAHSPGSKKDWLRPNAKGDPILAHAVLEGSAECVAVLVNQALKIPGLDFQKAGAPSCIEAAALMGDAEKFAALLPLIGQDRASQEAARAAWSTSSLSARGAHIVLQALLMGEMLSRAASAARKKTSSWGHFDALASALRDGTHTLAQFTHDLDRACLDLFDGAIEAISSRNAAERLAESSLIIRQCLIESPAGASLSGGSLPNAAPGSIAHQENLFTLVDPHGRSLFHMASELGRPAELSMLLRTSRALWGQAPEQKDALRRAAARGHAECVKLLLPDIGYKAEPSPLAPPPPLALAIDSPGPDGRSCLSLAAGSGSLECCEILLDFGASATSPDNAGFTPFMRAVEGGHLGVMKELGSRNPLVHELRSDAGETAAMIACWAGQPQALALLCSSPELMAQNARQTRSDGSTALMMAAGAGSLDCVEIILAASDPNAQNQRGANALFAACHAMSAPVMERLAPLADPAATDADGMTALIYAIVQQPDAGDRVEAISSLAKHQDPRAKFTPSAKFRSQFGDAMARSFDAIEWAQCIAESHGRSAAPVGNALNLAAARWDGGELPPARSHPLSKPPSALLSADVSLDASPAGLVSAAKLARRRLDRAGSGSAPPTGVAARGG